MPISRYKMSFIWLCTGVLDHAVLHTAVSTQTSHICNMLTVVLWKQCEKLRVSVHLLYVPGDGYDSLLASLAQHKEGKVD